MIKVSDYIVKRLADAGIKTVFMISGGGAMHLNDSVGRCKDIEYICNHHEQASAIAAEGYARTAGIMAAVIVTSGPGGTNTLTGVIGQWLDSVPVIYISGQVKRETTIESCGELILRQLGDQEINIVDIVRPVTKFAAMAMKPTDIGTLMDRALHEAVSGRPGPVWLDVPLDVQGSVVDEETLDRYHPAEVRNQGASTELKSQVKQVLAALSGAVRPVFLAGHGIRIAGGQELLAKLVERLGIPVLTSFCGYDLIPSEHPLFIGRIGTIGSRAGNFALQNADLLISVGSRNNIRQISYDWNSFARNAKKIIVDIDAAELKKPTVKPDLAICADAVEFLIELDKQLCLYPQPDREWWLNWCTERKSRYPVVTPEDSAGDELVNPYHFMKTLTSCAEENAVMVAGNGSACVVLFQAGLVKKGQRIFWNSGCASMGYDLPAAIGACIGTGRKDVICLAGDGSIQMNIQELQTVAHHRLPIKLFILNNDGYISIRQTQESFFEKRYVACDDRCGVSFPDITKLADAYGLPSRILDSNDNLAERIYEILKLEGPVICEVRMPADYIFKPKLSSERKTDGTMVSKPLEDMYPFLEREEFRSNMILPPSDAEF